MDEKELEDARLRMIEDWCRGGCYAHNKEFADKVYKELQEKYNY